LASDFCSSVASLTFVTFSDNPDSRIAKTLIECGETMEKIAITTTNIATRNWIERDCLTSDRALIEYHLNDHRNYILDSRQIFSDLWIYANEHSQMKNAGILKFLSRFIKSCHLCKNVSEKRKKKKEKEREKRIKTFDWKLNWQDG